MRTGRTPQREHVVELAGYVLALVLISLLLPGQRIVGWNEGAAPDILLDATPGALRGVEVAGRTTGGLPALWSAADGTARVPGKAAALRADPTVAEAYLSLWCLSPSVSLYLKVKP